MQTTYLGGEFRAFLSYTSREGEVRAVQPLVDNYCRILWEEARARGLNIFYDHFSLAPGPFKDYELAGWLRSAIDRSHLFVSFLSPSYVESEWCRFEWHQAINSLEPVS